MPEPICFLFDENVRSDVVDIFEKRGHTVLHSRDMTFVSAPDQLIAIFGKYESLVIVSHDKDFKKYRQLLPQHERRRFSEGAGRLHLDVPYARSVQRVNDEFEAIEFHYQQARKRGRPFLMTVAKATIKVETY